MKIFTSGLYISIMFSCFILFPEHIAAHSWMAPKVESVKTNPVEMSKESIMNGKAIFSQECAYCHGENGRGMSDKAAILQTDTADLLEGLKSHSDGDYHWKIRNGKGEMPGYEGELSNREIWDIINYLKSIIE